MKLSEIVYRLGYPGLVEDAHRWCGLWDNTPEYINAHQLNKFNKLWADACHRFTIYREQKNRFQLPDKLSSIDELKMFPVLEKSALQEHTTSIQLESGSQHFIRTGGTSGMPVSVPVNALNKYRSLRNASVGRLHHGIGLGDKLALVWGHSHLFGSGIRGRVNQQQRKLMDLLCGISRISAYEMSHRDIHNVASRLANDYYTAVIGYSSFLREVAQVFLEKKLVVSTHLPRTWIYTSEQIFDSDEKKLHEGFNAKLVVEYGMAEFGAIAYSRSDPRNIFPFWWSFHTRIDEDTAELFVTDLDNVAFPLINYRTGDLVEAGILGRWNRVIGRANDNIDLPLHGGQYQKIHSEIFTHILKNFGVEKYQVRMKANEILILVPRNTQAIQELKARFMFDLKKQVDNVDQEAIRIDSGDLKEKTIAGKYKFILDERK